MADPLIPIIQKTFDFNVARLDALRITLRLAHRLHFLSHSGYEMLSQDLCQALPTLLHAEQTLDGGTVLPGFCASLHELFAELDRQSSDERSVSHSCLASPLQVKIAPLLQFKAKIGYKDPMSFLQIEKRQ